MGDNNNDLLRRILGDFVLNFNSPCRKSWRNSSPSLGARIMTTPNPKPALSIPSQGFPPLLESLRSLIAGSRRQVLRAVDAGQVQTYWQVGRHIVEFEQGGEARASYGKAL